MLEKSYPRTGYIGVATKDHKQLSLHILKRSLLSPRSSGMKTPPVQQQQSRTGYQTYSLLFMLFMLLSPLLLMSLILNPEQIT